MSKITLKDVAAAAGVSLSTASLAMTGKGRISSDVRQQVLAQADRLAYKKTVAASFSRKATPVIGLLFSIDAQWGLAFEFVRPILEAIDRYFSARAYTVALIPIEEKLAPEELFRRIDSLACVGLFSLHFGHEALFSRLESRAIPVVLIMNGNYQDRFSTVCVDDFQGAYEGAVHLLQAAHRKIVFVDFKRLDVPKVSVDRFIGVKKALEEFKIPEHALERITDDPLDHDSLKNRLSIIFSAKAPPTAVFALDDELAARTLFLLNELGFSVPRDVSLIAPGDLLDYRQEYCPQISTLKIDTALMGRIACELMDDRLQSHDDAIHVLKVKQQLVLRGSTRPISA